MGDWTVQQRAFAVERFFHNNDSYTHTVRDFRREFKLKPKTPVFTIKSLHLWVKNFRECGTVAKKKPPGLAKSVRTTPTISRVRAAIQASPCRSARMHAKNLNLSDRTVRRILHFDLNYHPYKILYTQQLLPADYAVRMKFCEEMLLKINSGDIPLNALLITDEAHFYLHGDVNKQDLRYWSEGNPRIIQEKPLHLPKVTAWMGIAAWGVIGPYFFEGTVNGDRYRQLLTEFVGPELKKRRKFRQTWFQQDDATCHTSNDTMDCLKKLFCNRIISRNSPIVWPSRSPDLSACDYFLWGYLKSKVYENKPKDLEELKTAIKYHSGAIPTTMLEKVFDNFVLRMRNCCENHGHHLNDVIFKTTKLTQ